MYLLKFYKASCNPCAILSITMKQVSVPNEVKGIIGLDATSSGTVVPWGGDYRVPMSNLLEAYSIRTVPTLVLVDEEGNEFAKRTGSATPVELETWYAASLAIKN